MKTKVYSVFDSKAAVYGTPFFMPNDAMAVRAFTDLVNGPENMISTHPEDFSLFVVGDFDDQLAKLAPVTPLNLVTAASVKRFTPELLGRAKAMHDKMSVDLLAETVNGEVKS